MQDKGLMENMISAGADTSMRTTLTKLPNSMLDKGLESMLAKTLEYAMEYINSFIRFCQGLQLFRHQQIDEKLKKILKV